MPRINIEDKLLKSKKFDKLRLAVGSREFAIGALYFAWTVAQEYWMQDHSPIPLKVWSDEELCDDIIECGLADKNENGVYLRGAKEQFAWLEQRRNAGRKGGQATASGRKRPSSKRKQTQASTSISVSKKENTFANANASGDAFVSVWNEHCGALAKCKKLSVSRARKVEARLREIPNLDEWREIVKRLAASDFCTGKGDTSWRASFDWLVSNSDNAIKILEGNYDNRERRQQKTFTERKTEKFREFHEKIEQGKL